MLTSLTKGGGGVSQLLTITDKGGGVQTPQICEQSLVALLSQLFQASATVCHCLTIFKVKIQLNH